MKVDGSTLVDVSLNELPLIEAARFLNQVQTESILVPTSRMSEQISRTINRKSVGDVLDELGLTTRERIERGKRRMGFLLFLAGFLIAAVLFGLVL
ncbi:MAG TPA: hypothetical protein VJP59_12015 [Gemmatimonadota bacterium]|nr:hypothetical protein [Gemmatimonadota bacterium]